MLKTIDWNKSQTALQSTLKVIAAWAFGSAIDGKVRPGADADIGILTESPLTFDEQLDLIGKIQTALQFENVDLVVLNTANPILRFEAVSGRRLYCRDTAKMAAFVSLTAREYEDEVAQWQHALQNYTK
ncbi:MAG: nucleotidyltransferase domain-containing protein [Anaerolineales bacterium]|nr:nucleotidyltransferase domain-containing protein [Anaerolineales bacterium]